MADITSLLQVIFVGFCSSIGAAFGTYFIVEHVIKRAEPLAKKLTGKETVTDSGIRLASLCLRCGVGIPQGVGAQFCPNCGLSLASAVPPSPIDLEDYGIPLQKKKPMMDEREEYQEEKESYKPGPSISMRIRGGIVKLRIFISFIFALCLLSLSWYGEHYLIQFISHLATIWLFAILPIFSAIAAFVLSMPKRKKIFLPSDVDQKVAKTLTEVGDLEEGVIAYPSSLEMRNDAVGIEIPVPRSTKEAK